MKKYETYKDSGIEWIGEMPEGWQPKRIKYFADQITTPSTNPHKIGLENIESKTGRYVPSDSEFEGNGVEFKEGDVVYGKLRPYLQKVWLAEFAGNAVGDFFVYRAKDNVTPVYLKYLFLSDIFTSIADGSTYGAKMPRVSSEFIANTTWFLPSKEEQKAIAAYLDHKVASIDKSVDAINTQIEDLKSYHQSVISEAVTKGLNPNAPMKDSGIEWIGEIPEGWQSKRIKYFADQITTPSTNPCKIGLENIESKTGRFIHSDSKFEGNGVEFREGDIVYGKLRPYLQKVWLAEFEGNAVGDFFVYRAKDNVYPVYLKYLFLSDIFTSIADGSTYGAKMPRVSSEFIANTTWFLPTKEEQQSIANYLDTKTSKIDAAIKSLETQRDDLNAMKQSIISEAVTGKIDVRDWYKNQTVK